MRRTVLNGSSLKAVMAGTVLAVSVLVAWWVNAAQGADAKAGPSAAEGFSTSAETRASYGTAEAQLGEPFPDDVELPAMSERIQRLVDQAGGEATFQDGFVESQLVGFWRCAWQTSYLKAVQGGDTKAEARAAHQLSRYYDLDAVKRRVEDPDHLWYKAVIDPALEGDLGPLKEDVDVNCAPTPPRRNQSSSRSSSADRQ